MIPVEPEPLKHARARYQDAIATAYDLSDPRVVGGDRRPGNRRRHVFDFEDGLRLIVSREQLAGDEHIHISASVNPGLLFQRFLECSAPRAMDEFKAISEQRFRELSGNEAPMVFLGWSLGKGVPHWHIEVARNDAGS